ncbi:MAG: porin [Gammaproteobacteria bacterium]|nr:porin [Gammaproteobacteria bacterium]
MATQRSLRSAAAVLLAVLAAPAGAVDLKTADGEWTFSLSGEVNVDYIFSNCQSVNSAAAVTGGLTCVGSASGSSVSNIGNGLLPAAFSFGVATTQDGFDLAAHLGLYPGIATNDGGSPNLQASGGPTNTALGSTGLDIRQVYMTFGNKQMGTFTLGRNIGLFGADIILADMTLPGVGAPGSAAGPAPANTTLGGIGLGYIYTDWLAQIDYTTPDISGFNATVGIFDPINSLSDVGTTEPKKAPGVHGKLTYTMPMGEGNKLYLSIAALEQKQYFETPAGFGLTPMTPYDYNGYGVDFFAKLDIAGLELVGYGYTAKGLGTTALFLNGAFDTLTELGATRKSYGFLGQVTYTAGPVKLGYNHGDSRLDYADSLDRASNPTLVRSNRKDTIGVYYSLTKNLMLLAEGSYVKDVSADGSNKATTVNVGAFLKF